MKVSHTDRGKAWEYGLAIQFAATLNLSWGKMVALPHGFIDVSMHPGSRTTALTFREHGWQLSFRIHGAESRIVPSLGCDVRLVGQPSTMSRRQMPYGRLQ